MNILSILYFIGKGKADRKEHSGQFLRTHVHLCIKITHRGWPWLRFDDLWGTPLKRKERACHYKPGQFETGGEKTRI